jgi:meso-butanediol dehydrogenase / (S,S)-butanediol dehydrogenase / diacetyl reductase
VTTSDGRLAGKRALVTGAGSGIGRATALRLAADGAAVAAVDVRDDAAERVATEVTDHGGTAVAFVGDVSSEPSVAEAVAGAERALGGLDTVAACAGITAAGATHEITLDAWQTLLGVNLTGMFLTLKHTIPHLVAAGGGSIVTVGSTASLVAAGRTSAYDASKGGVLQLTRAVAVEYVDHGIRANCVCPGFVATGLAANSRQITSLGTEAATPPAGRIRIPMERAADPDELAAVIAFLCSGDASFMTGVAVPVDGGYTAV